MKDLTSPRRLSLVDAVSGALRDTAGVEQMMRAGARAVVPELADIAVVVLDRGDADACVEIAHTRPDMEPELRGRLKAALPAFRELARLDARSGRSFRWIPWITPSTKFRTARRTHNLPAFIEQVGITSAVAVALRASGRTLGVFAMGRLAGTSPYAGADLAVAQVIARRIALAIEAARLTEVTQAADDGTRGLRNALQRWTRVFHLAGWGAAVVDGEDQRIEVVNPAFAEMHGYSDPEDLSGLPFEELLLDDPEEGKQRWEQAAAGPGSSYEARHRRADGSLFPVLVGVTPLEGAEPGSFVVTVQDLTELKRAEERLRRAQRMEAVGRLAGGVAHEVNNMMTIILGFSDLLGRAAELPEVLQRDVEEIRKAAARSGKITQQLLAFSRQQVLQPADLGVNSVIEELVPVLRLLLPANIRVETQLAPLAGVVRADRAQLEQVLINLAFNARDAMSAGGTIRIATEIRQLDEEGGRRLIGIPFPPGRYALASVIDTGHGMDPATLAQVFEPFFTTKPLGLGTGLGLATVYGIVKQSGGYVWVESNPGAGTTFTLALPTVKSEPAEVAAPAEEAPVEDEPGGTILVVEDEGGVRELAVRILSSRGYRVMQAQDAADALSTLSSEARQVDLVLTDVVVPDLGADELERRLHELRPGLPILYMSGYPKEDMIQRQLIRPDSAFLQKPFTTEELLDSVGRMLRQGHEVVSR